MRCALPRPAVQPPAIWRELPRFDEIRRILNLRGRPKTFRTEYNRFKADSNREYKRDATVESLHYVRVNQYRER